jgi:two-component system, chemotaxis family, CheB/CheR fusion protein
MTKQKKESKKENARGKKKAAVASETDALRKQKFAVVGIGGSAGSFAGFEKFFTRLPADTGFAYVVVIHLDPDHKADISGLLQRFTTMRVQEARDGMEVMQNNVYVIPPNNDLAIHDMKLLLLPPAKARGSRMPIDYFFQSLADDLWNKAVGIVFSGMGSDGETGVRIIKEKLGMVMVQDPETAQYNSMPLSAIGTNLVDYVLAPEDMPAKLIQYLRHPLQNEKPSDQVVEDSRNSFSIQKILMLLRSHSSHDFSQYKRNTIARRIDRRIAYHQLPDYEHYVSFLRENPSELDVLFNELLIGVTKFFRDMVAFESLKEKLIPVLDRKAAGEPLRVWVAGCSTGEEAYSIAIIISEIMHALKKSDSRKVQIFATDIDGDAIETARQGFYLENIVADVSKERVDKYFVKKNDGYQVKKELRELIIFAQHNLIKDAPFTRLDLLSCRNLLIYLSLDLQKKLLPIFHYSLNHRAILFLGPAETIGAHTEYFTPLDTRWKIFEQRHVTNALQPITDFPFNISQNSVKPPEVLVRFNKRRDVHEGFNRVLLEKYAPASVLLNEKGDILYVNGRTGKYLYLNPGEPGMSIGRMAREELRYAITNAVHQAVAHKGVVILEDIKLTEGNQHEFVTVRVSYLHDPPLNGLLLLLFEPRGTGRKKQARSKLDDATTNSLVEQMEKELIFTKQQLHTTIEQMETSLQDLKSTNEELQSTNEELQSTNEESLTTKEEMQSLNEELMTINMQHQLKTDELTQLNNDMRNLLDTTDIGTIFLDNKLHILRFTPQARKLLSLIPADIGRPVTHFATNFEKVDLTAEINNVLETLISKEVDVQNKAGEWYNLKIVPYRTSDNFISGAVVTFRNITPAKELEKQLDFLRRSAKVLVDTMPSPAVLVNGSFNVLVANKLMLDLLKLDQDMIAGRSFVNILQPYLNKNNTDDAITGILENGETVHAVFSVQNKEKRFKVTTKAVMEENNKDFSVLLLMLENEAG